VDVNMIGSSGFVCCFFFAAFERFVAFVSAVFDTVFILLPFVVDDDLFERDCVGVFFDDER
jgi:hypothetical protein